MKNITGSRRFLVENFDRRFSVDMTGRSSQVRRLDVKYRNLILSTSERVFSVLDSTVGRLDRGIQNLPASGCPVCGSKMREEGSSGTVVEGCSTCDFYRGGVYA